MVAFYEDVLGFGLNERAGDDDYLPGVNWAELHAPAVDPDEPDLEFLDGSVHVVPSPTAEDAPGRCILAFRVDDIREGVRLLEDGHAGGISEIHEESWGRFCYFKDPDGNDLELFEYRPGGWSDMPQSLATEPSLGE
jgi:catechol 2,3-dioxygenase-like lactoylglutathione lyase family enzyme